MKKILIVFTISLLILNLASAISVDVKKTSSNEVMVSGLESPVAFDLEITNLGNSDYFSFYNLLGFQMFPVGTIPMNFGQTKQVRLEISPIGDFDQRGTYTFEYFIRGQDKTEQKEKLTFRIIDLKDAFEIGSSELDVDSGKIKIFIKNKVNYNFDSIDAEFSSVFFEFDEKGFGLAPFEEKESEVELNNDDISKLIAGFYTIKAKVKVEDQTANVEGTIKFEEKSLVTSTSNDYGFFINTKIIQKSNKGNVVQDSEVVVQKNIISRLFTTFSPEPDTSIREGSVVTYSWAKALRPGEKLEVSVKTNWLFPIILILLIIATTIIAKRYNNSKLSLRKKVSFVRAKGGEFALKVSIVDHSKSYVERVSVIDRLPSLVKLHERFGGEQPSRIDEKTRRIEWNFEKLEAGERRIISYIIYSKVGIVGRFALPMATAIYDQEGKIKESQSNRAFFVAETREVKEDLG